MYMKKLLCLFGFHSWITKSLPTTMLGEDIGFSEATYCKYCNKIKH
jgi:hypothetical protein